MFKIIRRVVRAPLTYIADLRKITIKQYLLINTNFSPAYSFMIFSALLSTLALATFFIYYLLTFSSQSVCLENVKIGAFVIAILYIIETIAFFICLTGAISLAKNTFWKITLIIIFGPLLCGFGFGEVAFIQMCLLSVGNESTFNMVSIIRQPAFIQAMIYSYISFFALYFILVPSIQYLYKRQLQDQQNIQFLQRNSQKNKKEKPEPNEEQLSLKTKQKSCCNVFVCIVYYTLHILFVIALFFIFCIKVFGPLLFTYIWIQIAINISHYNDLNERIIFGLSLTAYFLPLAITLIGFICQKIPKLCKKKKLVQFQQSDIKERNTIQLTQNQNKSDKMKNEDLFAAFDRAQNNNQKSPTQTSNNESELQRRKTTIIPKKTVKQALL